MQKTLTLQTQKQDLPDGVTASGSYRFIVTGGASPASQDVAGTTTTFDLDPGSYSATAQAIDTTGNLFGPIASASFTVTANAQFDAPVTLTVA